MSIAKNIRNLRKSHGLTQTEFGKIAGVSDKAVSTWETGAAEPRMGAIQQLADYFSITKSEIIEDPDALNIAGSTHSHTLPMLDTGTGDADVPSDRLTQHTFCIDDSVDADFCMHIESETASGESHIFFIRKVTKPSDGRIYAVLLGSDRKPLVRMINRAGDTYVLTSCDTMMPPVILKCGDVSIIGEVTGVFRHIGRQDTVII